MYLIFPLFCYSLPRRDFRFSPPILLSVFESHCRRVSGRIPPFAVRTASLTSLDRRADSSTFLNPIKPPLFTHFSRSDCDPPPSTVSLSNQGVTPSFFLRLPRIQTVKHWLHPPRSSCAGVDGPVARSIPPISPPFHRFASRPPIF